MNKVKSLMKGALALGGRVFRAIKGPVALAIGTVLVVGVPAYAGTDATAIVDAAESAFVAVATLCVTIGTFFIVYRLAKRVR